MVKLRSRLIRSPFLGGDTSNTINGGGADGSSLSFDHQRGNNNNIRRRNNSSNQEQQEEGNQQPRRSQRLESSLEGGGSTATNQQQRRPFESLPSASEHTTASAEADQHHHQSIASPRGKRKPESRGITASIRRAKTAMFRMASSPMNSNNNNTAGVGVVSGENDDSNINAMDTTGGDTLGEAVAASSSYSTPMAAGVPSHRTIHRTPSQEENVPPMALLSPNCGMSYYAHVAAADNNNNNYDHAAETQHPPYPDEDTEMDDVVDTTNNVLDWMKDDAPPELLPKLLSFCGSRKVHALSRVNKAWNAVMKDESVWRVLCEDTHKWSDGDEVPSSWAQHYKQNPCVPIDYDTIEAAFESISSGPQRDTVENQVVHRYREQRTSARILIHPGPYFLRRPLVVNIIGDAELTIQSIDDSLTSDPRHGMTWKQNYHMLGGGDDSSSSPLSPSQLGRSSTSVDSRRPSSPTLRQIFGCGGRRRSSSPSSSEVLDQSSSSFSSIVDQEGDGAGGDNQSEHRAKFHYSCFQGPRSTALLCLESRKDNEPIIRVRQGNVNLRGLKFVHYCEGTDIWNGNSAIQVQRAFGRHGRPLRVDPPSVLPTANVSDCDVMSLSGRGIVVIDGGLSHIHNCNVHTSAATGVYVGGSGSMATMTQTDVVDNGTGNTRNSSRGGRGVARGHSGVYVEQGLAKMKDCNISNNSLTGISAVSTVQARLHIEESDIRANRSDQMELPPMESGRSINRNNIISSTGPGRPRSKWLRDSVILESPRGRIERGTPQSPVEDLSL